MMYLNHARHIYHQLQIGTNHPCSEEQVIALERSLGCSLPLAYKEFLFWMGLGTGPFLRGSRCFYNDLLPIQASATHMLPTEASFEHFPEKSFVFWMHQGYQFLFFRPQDGDDPPVHYYNQGENARRIIFNQYDSFSQFLAQEVIGHAQLTELIAEIPAGLRRFPQGPISIHPRRYDAERKLVYDVMKEFGGQPGSVYPERRGKVSVVTEQPVCIACEWEIHQLRAMYPNMKIEVRSA